MNKSRHIATLRKHALRFQTLANVCYDEGDIAGAKDCRRYANALKKQAIELERQQAMYDGATF